MIIETDWDFYHEWTLLELSADHAEAYAEEIGCSETYKAALKVREEADNFYEKNYTKIQRHLDWCHGKEICK